MIANLSKPENRLPAAYAAAALTVLIWGASPAATKIAVNGIDPLMVGALRTVLAAALVLPLALYYRLPLPTDRTGWLLLLTTSLSSFIAFTILFSFGSQQTSGAHAALINGGIPIFTAFFGVIAERRIPGKWWFVGIALALAGEILLIGFRGAGDSGVTLQGDLLVVISSACAGLGYVTGVRLAARIGSLGATFWAIGLAGVILLPVLFFQEQPLDWMLAPADSLTALGYLVIGSSLIAFICWFWALDKGGIVRMAPVQFAMPLVSLFLAVRLLNEPLTLELIISAAIIITGIVISQRSKL